MIKNKLLHFILLVVLPLNIYSQSYNKGAGEIQLTNSENYIHTRNYTSERDSAYLDGIEYFDGFGRSIQKINIGITPTKKNMVSLFEYDFFDRNVKSWLPAIIAGNSGTYVDSTEIISILKFSDPNFGATDKYPYYLSVYESSSLNRALEQYAPGADWHTNKKAVRTTYLTNVAGNDTLGCKLYNVTENLSLTNLKNYDTGELYVTRIEDEDGNASFEFKDKLGQVVLTRQLIRIGNSKILHDTYYVYDDFGNQCFVLPPRIQEEGITQAKLDELAYQYRYDHRNRCIWKKLPGVDPVYYVYDKADQLIFTQDGEQRKDGKDEWAFSIPDAFGRVVLTGTCKTVNNGSITTERFNNNLIKAEFSTSGAYVFYKLKLDSVDLTLGDYTILTANYYDNYDFRGMAEIPSSNTVYTPQSDYGTWSAGDYTEANKYKNKGLLTGALVARLDENGTAGYLYSVMYYDNRGRLIQTKSNNHLKGTEEEYMAYNFTGQPVKKLHVHNGNNGSKINEKYTYTYDHAGRLYNTKYRLNNQKEVYLLQNRYDELGRLLKKGIGQSIPMDVPLQIRNAMSAMEDTESGWGDSSSNEEVIIEEPEQVEKESRYIGSLGLMTYYPHSAYLYADRRYTPDFQLTLQQDCWLTIEYPYSALLGQTVITFFSPRDGGGYDDLEVAEAENISTITTQKFRFRLGAGTHNFNIYTPFTYDPQGSKKVHTTIRLSTTSDNSEEEGLDPNKENEYIGVLSPDKSITHTTGMYGYEQYATYLQMDMEEEADVTIRYLESGELVATTVKFFRNENGRYQQVNTDFIEDITTASVRQIKIRLMEGNYIFYIYSPDLISGGTNSVYTEVSLSANAIDNSGGGETPGGDQEPYHPADFTVTPMQTVEYAYNIRSWTKSISSSLFNQTLYYNEQAGTNKPQYGGNISAMEWCLPEENKQRGYNFEYDDLSRLTSAGYLVNGSTSNNYSTAYSYDKHGNMQTTKRYGKTTAGETYDLVDYLTMTYNGNQLVNVKDVGVKDKMSGSADFMDYAEGNGVYTYNKNGAMDKDTHKGITGIEYNSLNLPVSIEIDNGSIKGRTKYVYSASGVKLQVTHETDMNPQTATVMGSAPFSTETTNTKVTDYVGNKIYEDGVLKKILVDGGYIDMETGEYHFYIQDHLGNNRVVAKADGTVVQKNHYYPFGMEFAENSGDSDQPYKYNGKELDRMHGLNMYDYSARYMEPAIGRFTTVDPHAENYYSWSPYAYAMNNPLKYIDPLGTDTVPANEIWRYDNVINYSSEGGGQHSDNFYRVKNKNGDIFYLHLITSGENEGNYVAIQQNGKATEEVDGKEVEVDLYDYSFIVGKDRVSDFKAGETKEDGQVVRAKRIAMVLGVDGRKSMWENIVDNYKSNWDHPLKIMDNIGNIFVNFTKPVTKPRAGGGTSSTPTQIGNYYHNYTPIKGTKNNPLKGREIMKRLK